MIIVALLGGVVVLMMQGVIPGFQKDRGPIGPTGPAPLTLELWNVFESSDIYAELIEDFVAENPHVTINYTKRNYIDYRTKLTEAFANGTAPDIFAIHNTWLPLQQNRISPAPGTLLAVSQFNEIFPRVVSFDFVRETKEGERLVYALPLAIETLGLFYNKDYFETANVAVPPRTWEELLDYTKLFTQLDETGQIKISGIALGTADNINRATDVISLLMMQGGARMNNELLSEATFDDTIVLGEGDQKEIFTPARDALEFYLAFSDNTRPVYSWNKQASYSIDAFVEGKAAMMVNYPHNIPVVQSKAPHLNFKTASVPQLQDRKEDVNYASYWGFTVSKNSPNAGVAWQFIDFLLQPNNLKKYLTIAQLPTARRDLILWQQQDENLRYFANQIISARSWYQGDSFAVETVLGDMINSALVGERTTQEALEDAAARITVIIQKINE